MFNRYWTTGGGAETYGAAMAQVLARTSTVELLGPDLIEPEELAKRLRLDLTGVTFRQVGFSSRDVGRASADYDLFVNVSYLSVAPSRAPRSVYVVHFPAEMDADLSLLQKAAIKTLGPLVRPHAVDTEWGEGFYPREGARPRCFWTNGNAQFFVRPRPDVDTDIRLVFVRQRPSDMEPVEVCVEVDGAPAMAMTLSAGGSRLSRYRGVAGVATIPADPDEAEVEVRVRSDTFVPAEVTGGDDTRRLGVALTALHTGARLRDRLGAHLGSWFPLLYRSPADRDFLDSYDHVVCNSEFTQGWLRRWWGHEGEVLYPPVRMHQAGPKEPIILSVGRFFGPDSGHSKKQIELVDAFRRLRDRGVEDWTLHLVGGCGEADRPYLAAVREAAAGLPVVFHVDAPGEELEDLYARASLFWHATGLGEDPEVDPHRLEHFGIATVEAMSAGVVPIVYGAAGQVEIVQDDVSGRHFTDLDELVDHTVELAGDPDRRAGLSRVAAERARDFSPDRFAERLALLLDDGQDNS
jgi:glycosyltransferase involved in cell wall biosynthesis